MSISIYYEAKRATPLTPAEKEVVQNLVDKFSVDKLIEKYMETGEGHNWESFCVYEKPTQPDAIFEGATKLPDNSGKALEIGVKWWCLALTGIRRAVKDAKWDVRVEDHPIYWDERKQVYDPTK